MARLLFCVCIWLQTQDVGEQKKQNEILKWVAWKRGVYFAKVDPNGTSQTCPQCGAHTGKKELSQRVHHCAECGYTTDQDVAVAQVVEQRKLVAVGQTVILPVEEGCLLTPMKQETSRVILGSSRSTRKEGERREDVTG